MTTAPGLTPQAEKLPLILAAVVVVAVVIPAGLLGGAFAAPVAGLPDVGALVRWGLPIVRAIHDLAAASTIGLLVVAATIIPEERHTSRRITAARYACACGIVWVVAGVVGLLFSFADISGTPISDPTFATQFQTFVFQLDFLRVAAISSALALVVAVGAAQGWSPSARSASWRYFRCHWPVTPRAPQTTTRPSTPSPCSWSRPSCGSVACSRWRSCAPCSAQRSPSASSGTRSSPGGASWPSRCPGRSTPGSGSARSAIWPPPMARW